jgi:uroporphyrinogen-III synthase
MAGDTLMSKLNGRRIALVEGRMPGELADLVRRHGGEPMNVPAVREATRACAEEVGTFLDRLSGGVFQIVVCLTGVGVMTLARTAEQLNRLPELLQGLQRVTTVCRGPKPLAALKRQGITATVQTQEPYTTAELLVAMAGLPLSGQGVALVHYGERNAALADALRQRRARLDELCLYEWLLPEDLGPLQHLVGDLIAARVDAIAFTSQVQVRHLWQVASSLGKATELTHALTDQVVVAAVGPTCAAALADLGVMPRVVPAHPKMGPMVTALAAYFEDDESA